MASSHTIIHFADDFDPRQYRLLELPKEIASLFETSQQPTTDGFDSSPCLIVRGQEADEATLHTHNKTYAIRDVQTSNTLLLAKPSAHPISDFAQQLAADPSIVTEGGTAITEEGPSLPEWTSSAHVYEIEDCLSNYVELAVILPRVGRLTDVLGGCLYGGPKEERNVDQSSLQTTETLHDIIQASDAELLQALKDMEALEVDAEDMPFDRLTASDAIRLLADSEDEEEIPDTVVRHLLKVFSEKDSDGEEEENDAWSESVPDVFSVSLDMLKGIALIEGEGPQRTIRYFPKSALPSDAKGRFAKLFDVKGKWAYDELLPYVDDLAPDRKKLDATLLKFGRSSRVGDMTYYTSRFTPIK
ncbi:Sister chromatid cohesion protein DCC1 [Rhizophlyctis rosea]|nr:Sister chromatid cohesion protein DCC1 [Rhizophlyctis rosea]